MQKEREMNWALKGRLEVERLQVYRRAIVLSAVCKAEISDGMHALPPVGPTMEVEALEKRVAYKVALLVERAAKEADTLVAELEQVKADSRDLHNANVTFLAELTEARLQVEGLQKENQQLEDENAHQARLIWSMRVVHDFYRETMERMSGAGSSTRLSGAQS
uniref:Uncharacterized protein n=1 Tax=Cannabis sativa TaxID=3483 RepID=A0A803P110_CANSA